MSQSRTDRPRLPAPATGRSITTCATIIGGKSLIGMSNLPVVGRSVPGIRPRRRSVHFFASCREQPASVLLDLQAMFHSFQRTSQGGQVALQYNRHRSVVNAAQVVMNQEVAKPG